jgi:hypothetical protein
MGISWSLGLTDEAGFIVALLAGLVIAVPYEPLLPVEKKRIAWSLILASPSWGSSCGPAQHSSPSRRPRVERPRPEVGSPEVIRLEIRAPPTR